MQAASPALVFGYTVVVAAPAHITAKIGEYPFIARRGRQHDPVLGGDAQRDQSRREEADAVTDLLPGDALPAVGVGVSEGLGVWVAATRSRTSLPPTVRAFDLGQVGFLFGCNQAWHVQSLERWVSPKWETR